MFTSSTGRLRPVWAFLLSALLSVAAFLVAGYIAGAIAGERQLVFEVIFRALLALLLIAGFVWLLAVADHIEEDRIAVLGLPRGKGWGRQFATGCAVGFMLTLVAVSPLAIWGNVNITSHFALRLLPKFGAVLFVLVVGALAEELIFRGYPFQHLVRGIGAAGAIAVFSVLFGTVHLLNPGASIWGLINTVLIGIVLAVAYLRTRALWLPWGIHFGWNAALGFVCGLPVSGLRIFNLMVRTSVTGPKWLTGGSYGVEASAPGAIAVLVGLLIVWKLPIAKMLQPIPAEGRVSASPAPNRSAPGPPMGL